ncbi:MAG: hypothetical protein QXU73_08145 [Thermoplasmata archaeon]
MEKHIGRRDAETRGCGSMWKVKSRLPFILLVLGTGMFFSGIYYNPWISWYWYDRHEPSHYLASLWLIAIGIALVVAGHLLLISRMDSSSEKAPDKSVAPTGADDRSSTRAIGWTMNGWCAVALLLALVPILFAWVTVDNSSCVFERNHSVVEVLQGQLMESHAKPVQTSATIFLIGTIVALVTPFGSAIQAAGVTVLLVFGGLEAVPHQSLCAETVRVLVGASFGALSSALLVLGAIRPLGFNFKTRSFKGHPRFWTFSRTK